MSAMNKSALALLLTSLAGCGQPLVEFADPSAPGTPPTVTSTDPGNSSTDVVLGKQVSATFSSAMDPATIGATTFTLKQGTTPIAGAVSYAGTTANFVPTSLLANTTYDATITTGAKDGAGLGIAADYKWTFTTGAAVNTTPPAITFINPADGATGVCPNVVVQARFNDAMDLTTVVAANFTLAGPAASVNGAVSYDPASHTASFTPAGNLSTSTSYVATVTTGMKDPNGNALAQDKVWSFTTGTTLCQPPVYLRSLSTFVAAAGAGLTNSGATVLGGDVGLSPLATCTSDGSPCNPALNAPKVTGTLYANDPAGVAARSKADLIQAYDDATARPAGVVEADLSGLTLTPGVYTSGSTMMIAVNGTLVLDAQGDSNAVWIFQLGSALTVNNGAKVLLVNGAKAGNVFWAIGSSSTLGDNVSFKGSILAQTANTVGTGSTVEGRLLCTSASITLLSNTITLPAP